MVKKNTAKKNTAAAPSKRAALEAQLNEKGIVFDPNASDETLAALVEANTSPTGAPKAGATEPTAPAAKEGKDGKTTVGGVKVGKPEPIIKKLPLVIEPANGTWNNPSAEEFAKRLNEYAYRNPKKWEKKQAKLVATLNELNDLEPEAAVEKLNALKGQSDQGGKVSYGDQRIAGFSKAGEVKA